MPKGGAVTNLTNITYSGSSGETWKVSVRDVDGSTVAGYFINGTGYTDGSNLSEEAIQLYFEENGASLDIAAGETLTLSHDGLSLDVYLPAVTVDATILYVDSNGVCFTDASLTTPADTITNITNEAVGCADASVAGDVDETLETVTITEANDAPAEGETADTVTIAEDSAAAPHGATEETITIAEAHEEPNEGETEDTVTIAEDSAPSYGATDDDIWLDDYSYSFLDALSTFMFVSGVKDMEFKGLKFVGVIDAHMTDTQGAYASVFYKTDKAAAWSQTGWVLFNKQGFAYIKVVGIEFKIAIKCSDYTKIDLDAVKVRWKPVDKRYVRGPYANNAVS